MKWKDNEGRNGGYSVGGLGGLGYFDPLGSKHKGLFSVCPVFFDVEVPLPGQQVVLVVVSELGFDVILAACHQSCGSFFQRGQEVVLSITRPVASHHVVRLINCGQKSADSTLRDFLENNLKNNPMHQKPKKDVFVWFRFALTDLTNVDGCN